MTEYKHPKDMTVPELCELFESEMRSAMHRFAYSRSEARKELEQRFLENTAEVIFQMVVYIRQAEQKPSEDTVATRKSIAQAWATLSRTFVATIQASS